MEQIMQPQTNVLRILGKAKLSESGYRFIKYCVSTHVNEGVLLFNVLTRELLVLTQDEYDNSLESAYLREHWFTVPEQLDEKKYVNLVRWALKNSRKKPEHITNYTILSTTDCNARCFYCYEMGRSRIPMNEETARKTAQYIIAHCGGKKVHLSWFGGEPLFNLQVIDLICGQLRQAGIEYKSTMVSNGYLFDDAVVKKAVECWNLERVQITLDGTEEVYNRSKAFIYQEGSAYHVVLRNIQRLLDANISVVIRLNLDLHNADDLLTLAEELADRFPDRSRLRVYTHLLFDAEDSSKNAFSDAQWTARCKAQQRLEDKLTQFNLSAPRRLKKELQLNHCMADSGNSLVIVPTGDVGLCEHYSESEFAGHIDREGLDAGMTASWKELAPELPECADCFYYPACLRLKKCATVCVQQTREAQLRSIQLGIRNEYQLWRKQTPPEEPEDMDIC